MDLDNGPTGPGEVMPAERFRRCAAAVSGRLGSPWAFFAALVVVVAWATMGPLFHFSNTWQLVINTGTTIVTFLMVFVIQATQNRDAKSLQLKLDELIRASQARNAFADLEDATDQELDRFQHEFAQLRKSGAGGAEAAVKAHAALHARKGQRRPARLHRHR
jgi:low affinity Fe/Cu permease